jgi:hypothetical protein
MDFVLTLAHDLRDAWQYFNAPVVFHSQTPLEWVKPLGNPLYRSKSRSCARSSHPESPTLLPGRERAGFE